jgi:hypothetical protein
MAKSRVTVYLVSSDDDYYTGGFTTVVASIDDARQQVLDHVWPKGTTPGHITMNITITPFTLDVDAPPVVEYVEPGVYITGWGTNKISVIKSVREITGMGLKEAKDTVEAASPSNPVRIRSLYSMSNDSIVRELVQAGVPQQHIISKEAYS